MFPPVTYLMESSSLAAYVMLRSLIRGRNMKANNKESHGYFFSFVSSPLLDFCLRFCFASHQACSGRLGPCSSFVKSHVGLTLRHGEFSMAQLFAFLQKTYVSVTTETSCRCRLVLLDLSCPCALVSS
ncbi:hypothetical protein V6N13_061934 [Hibiscus sabdariffa]|uniref:Uncharacterized protein n=2 Tax=Hibiscus sabdariffa TaxID=183260 RepID=A0ABR2PEX5_9ROSI